MATTKRKTVRTAMSYYADQLADVKIISDATGQSQAHLFRMGADMVLNLPENKKIIDQHKKDNGKQH
jgi:hypothetical protein